MKKKVAYCLVALELVFLASCSVPRATGPYKVVEGKGSKQENATKNNVDEGANMSDLMANDNKIKQEAFKLEEANDADKLSTFSVIVGSFSKKQNALNLKADLSPEYSAFLVVNETGMFRVVLVSYYSYQKAKSKISEIKDRFPDAWVLVQKQ